MELFDSLEIRIQTEAVRSDGWADGSHLDTADTWAITDIGDLEVSLVSPGGTPGVLDEVVSLSGAVGSVSDGEDTVVEDRHDAEEGLLQSLDGGRHIEPIL